MEINNRFDEASDCILTQLTLKQTKDIDLPADSVFAVAMRHQQEAEKEEKKRLKNLVLNLDLRDDGDNDGTDPFSYLLQPNPNVKAGRHNSRRRFVSRRDSRKDIMFPDSNDSTLVFNTTVSNLPPNNNENENIHLHGQGGSVDRNLPNPYLQPRVDRAGKGRASQRGRQLQVSDLDWYESNSQRKEFQTVWNANCYFIVTGLEC